MNNSQAVNGTNQQASNLKILKLQYATQLTAKIYRVQATLPLFGIGFLVAFLLNNFRYQAVNGTWLQTHFRWQVQTFIFGIIWGLLGAFLIAESRSVPSHFEFGGFAANELAGGAVMALDVVWIYYRIIKGGINLKRGQLMYHPRPLKDAFD